MHLQNIIKPDFWDGKLIPIQKLDNVPLSIQNEIHNILIPQNPITMQPMGKTLSYVLKFNSNASYFRQVEAIQFLIIGQAILFDSQGGDETHLEDIGIEVSTNCIYYIKPADADYLSSEYPKYSLLNNNHESLLKYIPIIIEANQIKNSLIEKDIERREAISNNSLLDKYEKNYRYKLLYEARRAMWVQFYFELRDLLYPIDSKPFENLLLTEAEREPAWLEFIDIPTNLHHAESEYQLYLAQNR